MQLRPKDIAATRAELLQSQGGVCPLCNKPPRVPCLDHCHKGGYIRAVLCRGCNSFEGSITKRAPRAEIPKDLLPTYLRNLADYLELHSIDQTGLMHPRHKIPGNRVSIKRKPRLKIGR